MQNELLALAYDQIDENKAERLRGCATWLRYKSNGKDMKLDGANFCRIRLCPVCQWRRSLKVFAQTQQVIRAFDKEAPHSYAMLTLTVPNCTGENLRSTIDEMMQAWDRMSRRAPWKKVVLGWYRGLEITHNVDIRSSNYDTYHPHFHVLLALRRSYWTSRYYLRQDEWTQLWKDALRAEYVPVVHIQKCRISTSAAIAEVTKYTTKSDDYIIPDDWDLTVETVRLLDKVLEGRKLTAYGGELSRVHKQLHLSDPEDGDLIHTDDEAADEIDPDFATVVFNWYSGYRQYYLEV